MKKQFLLIAFLVCLAAPALTTFLWLNYQKSQLKREVKWQIIDGIDKSELVLIHLSKEEAEKELDWEHSKEFEFRGEMYDVVKSDYTADSVKYWCWWDHEETKLNQKLAEVVDNLLGKNTDREEKEEHLSSYYQSLFLEKCFVWKAIDRKLLKDQFKYYTFSINEFAGIIPSPPPQQRM